MSLSENFVKPTTMLYRNLLAMETEELLRSHPVDGAVLMGGCDKTTPGLLMGAISWTSRDLRARRADAARKLCAASSWARAPTPGSTGTSAAPATSRRGVAGRRGRNCPLLRPLHDHGHGQHHDGDRRGDGDDAARRVVDPGGGCRPIRMASECGRRIVEMVWEDLTPATDPDAAAVRERRRSGDGDGLLDQRRHPPHRHGAPGRRRSRVDDFERSAARRR